MHRVGASRAGVASTVRGFHQLRVRYAPFAFGKARDHFVVSMSNVVLVASTIYTVTAFHYLLTVSSQRTETPNPTFLPPFLT